MKSLRPLRWLVLLSFVGGIAAAVLDTPPMTHYHVDLDVYVRDEGVLCREAWVIAQRRFGNGVAETVTMSGGSFDVVKCLSVVYQTADVGDEVVSAGIEVKRQ